MPYKCTVCNADIESADNLTTTDVPIFFFERKIGFQQFKGWVSRISSCASCLLKFGKPIKVMHRLYERDLAEFEKAAEVILKGSGSRDD